MLLDDPSAVSKTSAECRRTDVVGSPQRHIEALVCAEIDDHSIIAGVSDGLNGEPDKAREWLGRSVFGICRESTARKLKARGFRVCIRRDESHTYKTIESVAHGV